MRSVESVRLALERTTSCLARHVAGVLGTGETLVPREPWLFEGDPIPEDMPADEAQSHANTSAQCDPDSESTDSESEDSECIDSESEDGWRIEVGMCGSQAAVGVDLGMTVEEVEECVMTMQKDPCEAGGGRMHARLRGGVGPGFNMVDTSESDGEGEMLDAEEKASYMNAAAAAGASRETATNLAASSGAKQGQGRGEGTIGCGGAGAGGAGDGTSDMPGLDLLCEAPLYEAYAPHVLVPVGVCKHVLKAACSAGAC